MGPIIQERTASTTLKRLPAKEKVRVKNSENNSAVNSAKRGVKVTQNNRSQKKTASLHKNALPSPDKKPPPSKAETDFHQRQNNQKHESSTTGTRKLQNSHLEVNSKPQRSKNLHTGRGEQGQSVQPQSLRCSESVDLCHAALEKSRRALSLPLTPQPTLHQTQLQKQVPDLKSLHLIEQNEDDTDSASDLSDSERLPVPPSPCTPPQLNLRAEVINSVDLHPRISGQSVADTATCYYPDFLPPPFNNWSLRQLAIFLNTEGKRAPRPKPVGQLEKYLERLLELEWHQIQTIQSEIGRSTNPTGRIRGHPLSVSLNSSQNRPHTAPPTRLSSPKSLRHCQRAFPVLSSLGSPSSSSTTQLSRVVCPHCHVRYPLCSGNCSSYAYQRHSRLSPLLERRAPPVVTPKRSSSESRASGGDKKTAALSSRTQAPISPQAGKSHQRHMQVTGNVRRPSHNSVRCSNSKSQTPTANGRTGRGADRERQRDGAGVKGGSVEKCTSASGNKREGGLVKRGDKEGQRTETIYALTRSSAKRPVNTHSLTKEAPATKPNGRMKNVHFAK